MLEGKEAHSAFRGSPQQAYIRFVDMVDEEENNADNPDNPEQLPSLTEPDPIFLSAQKPLPRYGSPQLGTPKPGSPRAESVQSSNNSVE